MVVCGILWYDVCVCKNCLFIDNANCPHIVAVICWCSVICAAIHAYSALKTESNLMNIVAPVSVGSNLMVRNGACRILKFCTVYSARIAGGEGGWTPSWFERPPSSGKFQPPQGGRRNPPGSLAMNVSLLIITRPPSTIHYASHVYGFLTAFGCK